MLLLLPDFLRRLVRQVLMQADGVVPMLEFIEQGLQHHVFNENSDHGFHYQSSTHAKLSY